MSTGGVLIVCALVLWGSTEVVEFVQRRRAGLTALTNDNRGSWWVRALNVVALVLGVVGFVMWLTRDLQFFGIGF